MKLQTNNPPELKCKSVQKTTGELNPTAHQQNICHDQLCKVESTL